VARRVQRKTNIPPSRHNLPLAKCFSSQFNVLHLLHVRRRQGQVYAILQDVTPNSAGQQGAVAEAQPFEQQVKLLVDSYAPRDSEFFVLTRSTF
jgi:hypothetical protein